MIIKTSKSQFEKMALQVKAMHPYDVPEVIGVPVVAATKAYSDWVID